MSGGGSGSGRGGRSGGGGGSGRGGRSGMSGGGGGSGRGGMSGGAVGAAGAVGMAAAARAGRVAAVAGTEVEAAAAAGARVDSGALMGKGGTLMQICAAWADAGESAVSTGELEWDNPLSNSRAESIPEGDAPDPEASLPRCPCAGCLPFRFRS